MSIDSFSLSLSSCYYGSESKFEGRRDRVPDWYLRMLVVWGRVRAGTETAEESIGFIDGAVRAGYRAAREVLHSLSSTTAPTTATAASVGEVAKTTAAEGGKPPAQQQLLRMPETTFRATSSSAVWWWLQMVVVVLVLAVAVAMVVGCASPCVLAVKPV